MAQKDSYNFPVKAQYRQMWCDFIDERIPRANRVRSKMRVLCFPGHEGLEVTEVYDKLGIPRQNIVGIERNEEAAEELESRGLGIQIVREDLAGLNDHPAVSDMATQVTRREVGFLQKK